MVLVKTEHKYLEWDARLKHTQRHKTNFGMSFILLHHTECVGEFSENDSIIVRGITDVF